MLRGLEGSGRGLLRLLVVVIAIIIVITTTSIVVIVASVVIVVTRSIGWLFEATVGVAWSA